MIKKAIVCVDDEVIIVLSLIHELRSRIGEGFRYESAINPAEAREVIKELLNDGVTDITLITDWLMPGVKGNDFLLEIKNNYPKINSILITGQASDEMIKQIRKEAGVYSVFTKPWNSADLIDAVISSFEKQ